MARVRGSSDVQRRPVAEGWTLARVPAGAARTPAELDALAPRWVAAQVPGSALADLLRAGEPQAALGALDEEDVWYRCELPAGATGTLRFDGLATLCELFLDGRPALSSRNQFRTHEVKLAGERALYLRFASVAAALREKRPRPRWKVRLVRDQQLRWLRTTMQGRMPGWAPLTPIVGPIGGAELLAHAPGAGLRIEHANVRASLEGSSGVVRASLRLDPARGLPALASTAVLLVGGHASAFESTRTEAGELWLHATVRVPEAKRWWPHTHGEPALYAVEAAIDGVRFSLGATGFRTVELERGDGEFALRINGEKIFCAGALYTPKLLAPAEDPLPALQAAVYAGMNMIRLPGFSAYGDERLYDACDRLGLLVWQEFMFCNLDYPGGDAAFAEEVRQEARELLERTQLAPSLAVLCGSSEVPQQVAMLGLEPALANSPLFDELLPALSAELRPDVPYCAASATAARADRGPSHYYGVGAYRNPLSSLRSANVRFASECLAFSHVPREQNLREFLGPSETPPTAPGWKAGVVRDVNAGWDHEDVRDHYLEQLFRLDTRELRWSDADRWLSLSRVVPGEIMRQAIGEWRRGGSACSGALVLALRDERPSAGYGLLDSSDAPKASYWILRRALAPLSIFFTDEGVNGLALHAVNSARTPRELELKLTLLRDGATPIERGQSRVRLDAGGAFETRADEMIGRFVDASWAYRFGPLSYSVAHAQAFDAQSGALVAEAHHFPGGLSSAQEPELGLEGTLAPAAQAGLPPGSLSLTLQTRRFAQFISLEAPGFAPDDDFFHLAPGAARTLLLRRTAEPAGAQLLVSPLNASAPLRLSLRVPA